MVEKWFLLQLQVGVMVIVILLLRQCMKRLPKVYSYVLWLLVFGRLLCPFSLESRVSLIPSEQEWNTLAENLFVENKPNNYQNTYNQNPNGGYADGQHPNELYADGQHPNELYADGQHPNGPYGDGQHPNELYADSQHPNEPYIGSQYQIGLSPDTEYVSEDIDLISSSRNMAVLVVMLSGTAVILFYNLTAMLRIKQRLSTALLQEGNIYVSDRIDAPFVAGFLRPRIYLPATLTEGERTYILCHEQTHIRRKDYLVKNITFFLTAFYWYNPFVWVAFLLMSRDMEMSCDESVVQQLGSDIKKEYSQSLLNFAVGKRRMPVTPLTFGENSVKQRVKNVLSYKKARKWGCIIGAAVVLAAGIALFTTRGQEKTVDGQADDMIDTDAEGSAGGKDSSNIGAEAITSQQGSGQADTDSQPQQNNLKSAEEALRSWADAFANRDGNTLYQLTSDKEQFTTWDMVFQQEGGSYALKLDDKWYMYGLADIEEYTEDGVHKAVISYEMQKSAADVTIIRELVEVEKEEDKYYVNHKELTVFDEIKTGEEFIKAYGVLEAGENGISFGSTYMLPAVAFDAVIEVNQNLLAHTNDAYYSAYTDPVAAAVQLLHLGKGSGRVYYTNKEKTLATVQYSFAEDGSTVDINMQMAEPVQKIWMTSNGGSDYLAVYEQLETEAGLFQAMHSGIYLTNDSGMRCLYPYTIGTNPNMCYDGKRLFFMTDLQYRLGYLDWADNGICWVNPETQKYGVLELAGYDNNKMLFDFYINKGYIMVDLYGVSTYTPFLLSDDGIVVYNGKSAAELDEQEEQAYGAAIRDRLIANPGKLLSVSNRTAQDTYVLLDMDGDGIAEKITLAQNDEESFHHSLLDNYTLSVGGSIAEGHGDNVVNDMWAISLDGKNILLVLCEEGPSDDPVTHFYRYEKGGLGKSEWKDAGWFADDIRTCTVSSDGVIAGSIRNDVVQTNRIRVSWQQDAQGNIVQIPQDVYTFAWQNEVELTKDWTVYSEPHGTDSLIISPQKVTFTQVCGDFDISYGDDTWVKIVAADGTEGWFKVTQFLDSIFTGLNRAD